MAADPARENELETALRLAATEVTKRPAFIRLLLASKVHLLGDAQVSPQGVVEAGSKVRFTHWRRQDGVSVLPFFTSMEVLSKSIQAEEQTVALAARALFEITRGATLVLNPRSSYVREFTPSDVTAMLAHGTDRAPQHRIAETDHAVLIGQPLTAPTEMVTALSRLFAERPTVVRAWVALMHDKALDERAHLLIGIEVEGDYQAVLRDAGPVAGDTAPGRQQVDLMRVMPGDSGVAAYLRGTKPFYERR